MLNVDAGDPLTVPYEVPVIETEVAVALDEGDGVPDTVRLVTFGSLEV